MAPPAWFKVIQHPAGAEAVWLHGLVQPLGCRKGCKTGCRREQGHKGRQERAQLAWELPAGPVHASEEPPSHQASQTSSLDSIGPTCDASWRRPHAENPEPSAGLYRGRCWGHPACSARLLGPGPADAILRAEASAPAAGTLLARSLEPRLVSTEAARDLDIVLFIYCCVYKGT